MATKRRELEGLNEDDCALVAACPYKEPGCLGNADLDEPIFVIVAHDRCAPGAIRDWAERARKLGAPEEKWRGAMDAAIEVEAWQAANPHLVKDPD